MSPAPDAEGDVLVSEHHGDCPTLDIIIVNFRSHDLVLRCLASIERNPARSVRLGTVRIVDNSPHVSDWTGLAALSISVHVEGADNIGFGAACNRAARQSHADLLLFLNPDTEVLPETIAGAVSGLARLRGPAALGVQLLDGRGVVQRSCSRFPSATVLMAQAFGLHRLPWVRRARPFMEDWDHRDSRSVDQVMGAFLIMRRRDFVALGGFDERFFLYFEDMDLCRRIHQAGGVVRFDAGSRAIHHARGSSSTAVDLRLVHFLQSRILYAGKHHGRVAAVILLLATMLVESPLRLLQAARDRSRISPVLKGLGWFWRGVPTLFRRIRKAG